MEHENLTTAPLEEFSTCIPDIETTGSSGIHEETLQQFSVERFSTTVRKHMMNLIEQGPKPDS
jgi:hypothetical protein